MRTGQEILPLKENESRVRLYLWSRMCTCADLCINKSRNRFLTFSEAPHSEKIFKNVLRYGESHSLTLGFRHIFGQYSLASYWSGQQDLLNKGICQFYDSIYDN